MGQVKVRAKVVVRCVGTLAEPNAWASSMYGRDAFHGMESSFITLGGGKKSCFTGNCARKWL